ncbi:TPA: restriction endonuclease [Escherichia coli]|uniref:Restriction endonuclease n=4 Tax=Escherichia coli TaxID=562 RepID=A0AAD2P017_ECOLX|nr:MULTISPECIES: restriction endonuclease subunit S [Escherichia]EFA5394751.1 restriction endonuclease [Escherichia coli O6]EFN8418083.1 restriction endonuclease [Escherichia coli O150]EGF2709409.1 restriction endonuclease [Shigella sonnei]EEW1980290.1 restriction endonuclease [Escherichia coli]EEW2069214.1 restriction endonuclease [Escherichia coli]
MVKLGDVINVHYGKALKADQRVSNGSVHVFGSSGIVGNHDKTLCSYPTIIIGRKGSVGAITWAPDGGWIIDTAYYVEIKDNNKLDLRYLFYILSGIDLTKKTITTSIPGLNRDDLYDTFIKLPPFEEQKRIVDLLDKAEGIRQKREQAIKLADDFLRAKFLEMFGTPANNIHRFPKGTIRDLVDSVNYGTSAKASIDSGEYPILRMGNITYQGRWDFTDLKYLDLSVKEKDKYLVKEGDLLFNRTNSKELVGKTAVYEEDRPMAFAGYLIRVRPNSIGNNYYISGYLNSIHGKITLMNMCKSIVGMANINAQELQNIEILIPPKHLQDEYEIIYKKIKKGLSIYDKSAMQLQLLASNLSNKYFM